MTLSGCLCWVSFKVYIHLNFFWSNMGARLQLVVLSADVIIATLYYYNLAVLDAYFIAISEGLYLNFSWGTMPPDPPSFPLAPATHLKMHSTGPDH